MKKILYLMLGVVLLPLGGLQAQYAYFPQEGVITYEKTVHVKNALKRQINAMEEGNFQRRYMEEMINKVPETAVLKSKASFKGAEMNYEPIKETHDQMTTQLLRNGMLDNQHTVYQNLDKNESQAIFEFAGSNIFIRDELIDVKWKITNEYREIAGYTCRRANGVVLDSIYVVAFYTDQIPTTAGPGTVHGLPGMILGFVVPEQHINIYASEVQFSSPTIKTNVGGRRDTPLTREEMKERIKEAMGQWVKEAQLNMMIASMLL